jgi:CYTH domain-containing protein
MFSYGGLVCQDSLSVDQFLFNIDQEASINYLQKKIHHFNDLSYRLPLLEKLEFRTETNDFELQKQEYLVRVTPNSFKNRKTQGQYQETVLNMAEMELTYAKSQELRRRYEILVELYYTRVLLSSHHQHQVLYEDKVTLLRRSNSLPGFDILDLINAEDKVQENLHSILELEKQIITMEKTVKKLNIHSLPVSFTQFQLISMEEIKVLMTTVSALPAKSHSALDVLSAKSYKSFLEYEWEAAKSKFSLGYVQAKYGYNPGDPFRKSFSLGLGFDIPLKSTGRLDLNEIQVKIMEAESEYFLKKNAIDENIFFLEQQLNNLISRHELISSHIVESQAEFALREYSKVVEASPRAMLQLRENTLKKHQQLKELEEDIYLAFISYLDYSGMISRQEDKNWLSTENN